MYELRRENRSKEWVEKEPEGLMKKKKGKKLDFSPFSAWGILCGQQQSRMGQIPHIQGSECFLKTLQKPEADFLFRLA